MPVQLYIENILALEGKARAAGLGTGQPLPLAIMTSDDTHARTHQLLEDNLHFGARPSQIHLIKQEKARALTRRLPSVTQGRCCPCDAVLRWGGSMAAV